MGNLAEHAPGWPSTSDGELQFDGQQPARTIRGEEIDRRLAEEPARIVDPPRRRHHLPRYEHMPLAIDLDTIAYPTRGESFLQLPLGQRSHSHHG